VGKFLNNLISVLYKYYSKGATKRIPLFSSITVLAMILFMNLLMLSHLFGLNVFEMIPSGPSVGVARLILGGAILLPFYLVLYWLVDVKVINKCKFNPTIYRRWLVAVFIYYGLSIASLAIVLAAPQSFS
jgi:hypothetical protein